MVRFGVATLSLLGICCNGLLTSDEGGLPDSQPTIDASADTPAGAFFDTTSYFVDIASGRPAGSGAYPSAVIDHDKLLVVTEDFANATKPALFRCDLDGSQCAYVDIAASAPLMSGYNPSAVIDPINNRLLVATCLGIANTPALFRCNVDGSGCVFIDISSGQGPDTCRTPRALVDTVNNAVLVVTQDQNVNEGPLLFRCNTDGSGCVFVDLSSGLPQNAAFSPSAVLDVVNGKLLIAASSEVGELRLYRCNLDGTQCTLSDISAGQPESSALTPSAVLDTMNGKLLVVTDDGANDGKLGLYRCDVDGTGCSYADISAGQPGYGGHDPSAVIDAVNQKLLVATHNRAMDGKLGLFRCNLDGTACAFSDVSAGQPADSGGTPSMVINPNGGLLVASEDSPGNSQLSSPGVFIIHIP